MKVIIAGGRDFNNPALIASTMDQLDFLVSEVVCGDARGADTQGAEWAFRNGIAVKHFPADWDRLGNRAGFIRNEQMAQYADYLVAFWDGESHGTKHMIDTMTKMGKHGTVVIYEKRPELIF